MIGAELNLLSGIQARQAIGKSARPMGMVTAANDLPHLSGRGEVLTLSERKESCTPEEK